MINNAVLELADQQAALCRAFSNARRLLIVWILSKEELSVNEIAARAGSSLQNVSQHLSLLKKTGIVTTRRDGQTIYYQIADHDCFKQCPALLRAPDRLD
jgi:DNA-binding transcriptional ArsR family regulator